METAAQARIDDEINRLLSSVHDLRTRRNTFSPIARLPTETLASIFVLCAYDYHNNRHSVAFGVPSWVNISYVCRRWRDVALNYPTLWTYLFVASKRWTDVLLARSRQAPLKLRAALEHQTFDVWPNFAEKVLNQAERVQELCLSFPRRYAEMVFSRLSSHAPLMQILKISVYNGFVPGSPPESPWALFNGDMPSLRKLELRGCQIQWNSFALKGLTTLSLHKVPEPCRPSVEEFHALLSCMQELIYLHLDGVLQSARSFFGSVVFDASQKVTLPHLSRFLICAPSSTIYALLSLVTIPLKTELRLTCDSELEYDSSGCLVDYSPLYPLLAQRFTIQESQVLAVPTIRSLVITTAPMAFSVILGVSERDWDHMLDTDRYMQWGYNIPLKVVVTFGISTMKLRDRVISNICSSIPLSGVRSVLVDCPPFSPSFWKKALGPLQELRYIKLIGGYMPNLASVLSPTLDYHAEDEGEPAGQGSHQIFAPALEELELLCIVFSTGFEADPWLRCGTLRRLCDALADRKEEGRALGRFTMTRCCVDESDEQKLSDVVGEFQWDGDFSPDLRDPYWLDEMDRERWSDDEDES
ncbi:hypothetical protein OG21DRAFT_445625 [Imleria badia]|nr:hypothetical protein OG21DRAFT_445625 [Imleria badia]